MRGRKKAFTVAELLVVIAIMGILMALIVPAIMGSRQSARRLECKKRMGQVAIALLNYAQQHDDKLPPRGRWATVSAAAPEFIIQARSPDGTSPNAADHYPAYNWVQTLLPYLDAGPVKDHWNIDRCWLYANNQAVADTNLSVLVCPVDDTVGQSHGNLSYAVNGGFVRNYQDLATQAERERHQDLGVMWANYARPLDEITDGRASTILLGESLWVGYATGVTVPGNNSSITGVVSTWANPDAFRCAFQAKLVVDGSGNPQYGAALNINDPSVTTEGGNGTYTPLSSHHAGGVNVANCDGSVTFITEQIDATVFANLITPRGARRGEQPVSLNPFSK